MRRRTTKGGIAVTALLCLSAGWGGVSAASAAPPAAPSGAAAPSSSGDDNPSVDGAPAIPLLSPLIAAGATQPSPSSAATRDAASGDPAPTTSTIGLWAADWGSAAATRSSAGWEAAAENDSLLIGNASAYASWISKLHAWNPKLTVLDYNLGPYLQSGSSDFATILADDPSWFAHDAKGNLITLHKFPDNYLMEMSNPAYRAWHAQQLAATVNQYGFDGAMDDSMGTAPLSTNYATGVPIDPATGQAYTDAGYLANSVLMLDADKAALDGKYLAFNGLISGTQYERDTDILATSDADAGVSELFLRSPTSPITTFPSTSQLDATLEMMSDMAAHGKALLGWTKVWVSATSSQLAKWEEYALAVYLLGKGSASYWDFMPSQNADNTVVSYSNMKDQLGAPLGPYTTSGSTLSRSFQDGTVSLNTTTDVATITVT
jgi:hypothetical protein